MAKKTDNKSLLREMAVDTGESIASEALRSGGEGLVRIIESYLKRMPVATLRIMSHGVTLAAGAVQTPLERLAPLIGESKAMILAEAMQEFFAGAGKELRSMSNPTDEDVHRVADREAMRAGAWYSVRAELIEGMRKKRANFNPEAMRGLGSVAERTVVMRRVNEGIAMLAAADRSAYILLTGADFSTTELILNFELAVRQAKAAKAAGQDPIPYLRASLAVNTQDDSANPFVVAGMLKDTREYFGGKFDAVFAWVREQSASPQRPDALPAFRAGNLRPRNWWWLKNTNLRGFLTWVGFTSGALFTVWLIIRLLTVMVWFGLMFVSVWTGSLPGLLLALVAVFVQFAGFCASLTLVGASVGLLQIVSAIPVLVKREVYGLIGRDTSDIEIPKFQHALDVRWRVETACMGLGFLYLLFSVVLGANPLSAVLSFVVLTGAVVLATILHFLDDSFGDNLAWKQGALRGSAKLVMWLVVIGVIVALPSWAFFRLDSEAMGDYLAGVGALNLGRLLRQALPVVVLGLMLLGTTVAACVLLVRRDFRGAFKAGVVMVVLACVIALAQAFLPTPSGAPLIAAPVESRPMHNVPRTPREAMSSGRMTHPVYDARPVPLDTFVPSDPWSDSAEVLGDF